MTRDNASRTTRSGWSAARRNFALPVIRYLHESPATKEHMAMVAVKNHFHALKNPKAQLRYEITVEQALAAPIVVEPFGLYDCTPQSDGAAAVILAAEKWWIATPTVRCGCGHDPLLVRHDHQQGEDRCTAQPVQDDEDP